MGLAVCRALPKRRKCPQCWRCPSTCCCLIRRFTEADFMAAWPVRLLSCTERMLIFRSPARLGEVVDQILFERQVD